MTRKEIRGWLLAVFVAGLAIPLVMGAFEQTGKLTLGALTNYTLEATAGSDTAHTLNVRCAQFAVSAQASESIMLSIVDGAGEALGGAAIQIAADERWVSPKGYYSGAIIYLISAEASTTEGIIEEYFDN